MSTENECPAENPDTDDGTDEEQQMSRREQLHLKRQLEAIRAEADKLADMQAEFRFGSDADDETIDQLHRDLVALLGEAKEERDDVSIPEIAIVLWDELSRIEALLQNAEEQEREPEPEQGDTGGPDRVTPPDGETRQAAPVDDPTFQ